MVDVIWSKSWRRKTFQYARPFVRLADYDRVATELKVLKEELKKLRRDAL